jgi:hypothetical protein
VTKFGRDLAKSIRQPSERSAEHGVCKLTAVHFKEVPSRSHRQCDLLDSIVPQWFRGRDKGKRRHGMESGQTLARPSILPLKVNLSDLDIKQGHANVLVAE